MDSTGSYTRSFDESLIRELPQLQSLRIAPLRQPVSRLLAVPSPLEPSASHVREPSSNNNAGILPARNDSAPSGATEGAAAPRPKKSDAPADSLPSLEAPPRPILPAFVNLRALERYPYSSFDDDALHFRKRRRLGGQAETFSEHLQLPIPQAQKEQRPPPFGPFAILNGLNEPPPNAALLPPIEPGSITQLLTKPSRGSEAVEPGLLTANAADSQIAERREGRIEDILDSPVDKTADGDSSDIASGLLDDVAAAERTRSEKTDPETDNKDASTEDNTEPLSPKTRGRSRKNLRKWTEEETTALLRGVVKCGIGNWTAILAQPELKFNKRSASNLKDRFRVCCPWAYRAADPNEATRQLHDTLANALSRAETEGTDGQAGKIHLPHPRGANAEASGAAVNEASSSKDADSKGSKAKNSTLSKTTPTLSSRSKSTLASLGIPEPHFTMKSRRRSRRPFTVVEDEALLKGYAVHGFQWTLIQQDKRLNLSHRRATDLRDRFRTKFPHAYRDGGSVSGRLPQGGNPDPGKQHAARISARGQAESGNARGPIDPALSPPAPPQGLHESTSSAGVFSFAMDENSGVDATWADNTLAPMWDELT
ncbi:hypothetical protein CBS63078_7181 [Aspergillus niger]|uniref:GTP-binding protein rho3 domain protein n=2 Tax=Aspergillus niger TaxID=5061 RepID=A0A505HVK1_ASPNG|nr:hypothetical protein ASPNIDRAFT_179341 [Aspergillus niger ATCC 1015]KAI2896263.1 hypothetical protein CBS13152_3474 [Aspergillus niger]KAI2899785.1 hypothetical protein CBS63078_7181 [Aspergillus niger]KAI2999015.1 hypothetical protein CBS147346_7858 [Aspergillus niger]KAI3014064.1 hypothetical protein CBS147345_5413 [Aspergillus niger]